MFFFCCKWSKNHIYYLYYFRREVKKTVHSQWRIWNACFSIWCVVADIVWIEKWCHLKSHTVYLIWFLIFVFAQLHECTVARMHSFTNVRLHKCILWESIYISQDDLSVYSGEYFRLFSPCLCSRWIMVLKEWKKTEMRPTGWVFFRSQFCIDGKLPVKDR